ncbi:VWA domain-containing protein [Methylocystis sp. JAN1]|uniref:VWA domain-containing protein n=1 Tax=Methylocystis sp. JAN1 TaxID=3397211 RepID=UPI003FA31B59
MIAFGSFALLRPFWLLVPPALLVLLRLTRPRDASLGGWSRAVDPPLLAAMLRRQGADSRTRPELAIYWGVALIALALSGPAVRSADAPQFRNLDASLILLDASKSEGLRQGATAAQLILEGGGARQTGLVLYAGDAYLASPLTDDVEALESLLFAVDDETVPDGGARPDRALAFARRVLRESGTLAGDVVLVSGGAGVDARARGEAAALAAEGHALHTLVVAPRNAAAAADSARATMRSLAAEGRGVAGEASRPQPVVEAVAGRRAARVEQGARRALEWRDCGRWLLLAAVAPLLLFLRVGES